MEGDCRPPEAGAAADDEEDESLASTALSPCGLGYADGCETDEGAASDCVPGFNFESFDSGCEDPVERFMLISKWQGQLVNLNRRLRRAAAPLGRRTRRERLEGSSPGLSERRPSGQLVGAVQQEIRERRKAVASKIREGQSKVVGTLRGAKQQYTKQVDELKHRLDKVLSRARYAKARQFRHMLCFTCSMLDVVVTSFWLGASPETHYLWYTLKCMLLIGFRAVWYRWHNWHYYLFDMCYFVNLMLLVYLWVLPRFGTMLFAMVGLECDMQFFFNAVFGFSGVLLISVPLFRNSFVPHSLDKVTSVQIHLSPCLQLWVLRWLGDEQFPNGSSVSVLPSLCFYGLWIVPYVLHQFVIERKYIEKKGYQTLFHLFAVEMGVRDKLPSLLQGPVGSRVAFVLGHFAMFCSGLPLVHFPRFVHTLCITLATIVVFKNGAKFYITYFWKVYDNQIHEFEKQVAEASRRHGVRNGVTADGSSEALQEEAERNGEMVDDADGAEESMDGMD